jgi:hypothetical protein
MGIDGGQKLNPIYDSGDGTHMNDFGHFMLFNKVVAKNIPKYLLDSVNYREEFENKQYNFRVFPNSIQSKFTICLNTEKIEKASIQLYNLNGVKMLTLYDDLLFDGFKTLEFTRSPKIPNGIYLLIIKSNSFLFKETIIFN